jgi:curved DNA-binding protein CbpA
VLTSPAELANINSHQDCRVTDNFALLEEARRPWLDPDELKNKFLTLSAQAHPDRVHQADCAAREVAHQRYAALNAAYQCLRDPKQRLGHLLELELGAKPGDVQQVPQDLVDLFAEVGPLCRQVDEFLAENAKVTSPLLRVQGFERSQQWSEQLTELQVRVQARYDQALAEVKSIDGQWPEVSLGDAGGRSLALERLEGIYRLLGYFGRWLSQLQERNHRLGLSYV